MLGFINQSTMSAVSLAGQITFVLTLFYMGLSAGVGILTAQYWGKKDLMTIERVFSIGCTMSIIISAIFFVISLLMPDHLMSFFTNDDTLIRYGSSFLRVISFSNLISGISQMYFSVIRSMENARVSAWISSMCPCIEHSLECNKYFNTLSGSARKGYRSRCFLDSSGTYR
ncbi:MATE family efflux transporter [Paenibacillus sp. B-A-8]|uniref:MATE family efflux transporter n=1 Tax=Paenibacillus sp. B-A-8 TaxID=3400419 RepID=UPI003B011D7A